MARRRAVKTRNEIIEIWDRSPHLSSRAVVGEFKKRHGNTPAFDTDEIVDYGLMEIAGQVSRRPLIDDDVSDLFGALISNPERKRLRKKMSLKIRHNKEEVDIVLDVINLKYSDFFDLELVDRQPKPKVTMSPIEIIRRDMEKMRELGYEEMTYGEFLKKGG